MSLLGNIIWFVFGGLILGLVYIFFGLLYCITIVGIPFGYQLMKIGLYAMHPFGKSPTFDPVPMGCLSLVFNILWITLAASNWPLHTSLLAPCSASPSLAFLLACNTSNWPSLPSFLSDRRRRVKNSNHIFF